MLDTILKMFGPEAVVDIVSGISGPDAEKEFDKCYSRGIELLEKDSPDTIESDDDKFNLMSLSTVAATAFHKDTVIGTITLGMAMYTAYRLGMQRARLDMFESAEVKEDA